MGGQPYLFEAPKRFSGDTLPETFNPKAVTMASRQTLPPKPKQEGPLVDFNRHPDSYLVLPYGRTDVKPMNPRAKTLIKIARWIQLFFRVLQLLGAIGVLLCAIFLRGMGNTEGLIIRIPPGVDIVATLYAIYHLLRAAKARTPASSASYHFFALALDAGFIPFYVFTALLSNRNYNELAGTSGRWRTFFPTDEDANTVLHTTWLTATAVGGLHCLSLFLDLYLVIMFRKITRLPPDMNPLEEHLTSRRRTKHKHKSSSISAMTPLTAEEKRLSGQSMTTLGSIQSQGNIPGPDAEKMSFLHTRANSEVQYSPHTPSSVQQARQSTYSQTGSTRASRTDLHHRDDLLRRGSDDDETLSQRKSLLAAQAIKRGSRPNSMVSPPKGILKNRESSPQKNNQDQLRTDNWFVHPDSNPEQDMAPPMPPKHQYRNSTDHAAAYQSLLPSVHLDDEDDNTPMMPQPLRMNPPTPTRSPVRSLTSKSRYYGDLQSAREGIRSSSPTKAPIPNSPAGLTQTSFASVRRTGEAGYTPVQSQSPRVVSRSGVDYMDYDGDYDTDRYTADGTNSGRRRDVSGKIAEEGRGGEENAPGRWGGMKTMGGLTYRRVSGMA